MMFLKKKNKMKNWIQRKLKKWCVSHRTEEEESPSKSPSSATTISTTTNNDDNEQEHKKNAAASAPNPAVPMILITEKAAHNLIWDWMEEFTELFQEGFPAPKSDGFWKQYHTKDFLLMRPSGNPLDLRGLRNMVEKQQITDYTHTMIAVMSTKILAGGQVAVLVFTSEENFVFKGTPVEDRVTWTAVLQMEHNTNDNQTPSNIKITNLHRSTGKPVNGVYS